RPLGLFGSFGPLGPLVFEQPFLWLTARPAGRASRSGNGLSKATADQHRSRRRERLFQGLYERCQVAHGASGNAHAFGERLEVENGPSDFGEIRAGAFDGPARSHEL